MTTATVPPEPVDFAPRSIPIEYLQQLEEAQAGARRMYSAPDPAVSFWELPADPDARFGFVVLDAKEGWMRVELSRGAGEGWARTDTLAGAADLKSTFPELHFINGLIGYHLLTSPSAPALATLESFDRYLAATRGRAESEVRALAQVLQGNAIMRVALQPWPTPQLQAAERHYLAALAASTPTACTRSSSRPSAAIRAAASSSATCRRSTPAAQRGDLRVRVPADELARQRALTQSIMAGMD